VQNIKLFYFSFIFFFLSLTSCQLSELKEKGVLTTGTVTKEFSSGSSVFLRYEFNVDGKWYQDRSMNIYRCHGMFVGKNFPVIYHKENPKISSILIHPRSFENFNIEMPDSLFWLKDCFKSYSDNIK